MSYGDPDWQGWVLDEEKSLPLLEHAYKVGLNTWDTVSSLFPFTPQPQVYSQMCQRIGRRLLQWALRGNRRQSTEEI